VVALIPPTNLPGSLNNLYENEPSSYNLHKIDTKFDYTPTDKLRISFRYGDQPYNAVFAPIYGPILGGSHPFLACGACNYQQHGATLAISSSAAYVFSPTFVVDATFGVTQAHQYLLPTESGVKYGSDLEYKDPIFEYAANATKIEGTHTIRFGFDISRQHENHIETAPANFTFTGGVTSLNGGPSANQYNQIADFLLGLPQSVTNSLQIQQPFLTLRTWEFALYARDHWQVNRKLTVNYGARFGALPGSQGSKQGHQLLQSRKRRGAAVRRRKLSFRLRHYGV
jgi:hypothetical protein